MKAKRLLGVMLLAVATAFVVFGIIQLVSTHSPYHSGSSGVGDYASFGGAFYTYQYSITRQVAINTDNIADRLDYLERRAYSFSQTFSFMLFGFGALCASFGIYFIVSAGGDKKMIDLTVVEYNSTKAVPQHVVVEKSADDYKAEVEARRKAEEEYARKKAEEETRLKAEVEAKRKAEEEARIAREKTILEPYGFETREQLQNTITSNNSALRIIVEKLKSNDLPLAQRKELESKLAKLQEEAKILTEANQALS